MGAGAQECPGSPPVTISPDLPGDVCIPTGFSGLPIAFFDDFSWRSFIALTWTALDGQRGVADKARAYGPISGPLVLETYKNDWEVFQPSSDGKSPPPAPSSWNSYAGKSPCNVQLAFGDVVLAAFSKFANLGEAGFGELVGPLPAQNGTYTRYSVAYDAIEFGQILSQGLYLQANIPVTGVSFPDGAVDIKAAWMDMSKVKDPSRYYTRTAWVQNPFSIPPSCSKVTVGLVGLHIVRKTTAAPQWIWSTFEQVDNVPDGADHTQFNFNDGSSTPQPASNPNPFPPNAYPKIFNVERQTPLHSTTNATNAKYQKALSQLGGPWQFYRLVATQWPVPGKTPSNQGDLAHTFPGSNPTSAFANTTMETFDQKRIQTGCMNCHNLDAAQNPNSGPKTTDFLWSLTINAWPSKFSSPAEPVSAGLPTDHVPVSPAELPVRLQALKSLMMVGNPKN